jgi:UDP-N-acetylglucosamine 2-epimerase (non-hydrolysing)
MRILVVIGTRPEAIKMLPLVIELKKREEFEILVCFSGQHKTLANEVFEFFKIEPDVVFDIMKEGQSLSELTCKLLNKFDVLFDDILPDLVLVHGDTTTALCASLSAFYRGIKTVHIEAGLRTYDVASPFPEEFNRVAIDAMASLCFAPTERAAENLKKEGKNAVFTVGNTVIDALSYTISAEYNSPILECASGRKIILLTTHRRENIGQKMLSSLKGIRGALRNRDDMLCILPRHPNPKVQSIINDVFDDVKNIKIIDALPVLDFHNILARSFAVITDSGGIQEEAAYLGVPIFILRDRSERSEVISAGNAVILGTDEDEVREKFLSCINDATRLEMMKKRNYAFGCGDSSKKIADILLKLKNDELNDKL